MKKILILLALLLLITACGKEEAPAQPIPQRPETFYVPPPEKVTVEPMPRPEPIPDVEIMEPAPLPPPPAPTPQPVQANICRVLTEIGTIYTLQDVEAGKISLDDFSNLKKCYPYFAPDQANTDAMCCVI